DYYCQSFDGGNNLLF
nr:immunoglobulin light chain junction region [Macaca mulatta]MOY14808.1 immunoglobulin light chain junction region [Macaca mulatta]MOY14860.1 immunoglobulin light chain junction region [Macaca mulatta]MOY14932.1 immunoglobulin light chain junction region [Macaca mulatta]MOY15089.1 immunoglobulin light chain junction region [Macaca mulatta]